MKIDHIAIWTYNLEGMRKFYMHYFDASSSDIYYNHSKEFSSYFLYFDRGCRLELMEMPNIPKSRNQVLKQYTGLSHFAVNVETKEKVNTLTETFREDGFVIVSEPHITGDGYYLSVISDPDKNRVKIVAG